MEHSAWDVFDVIVGQVYFQDPGVGAVDWIQSQPHSGSGRIYGVSTLPHTRWRWRRESAERVSLKNTVD